MKKAMPAYPWKLLCMLAVVLGGGGQLGFSGAIPLSAAIPVLCLTVLLAWFLAAEYHERKLTAQEDFERVITSEEALMRPAEAVQNGDLLRAAGNKPAENEQLLRASE
jgi:hypothetical protein